LEGGHREIVSHAISQNGIVFVFQSPYNPSNTEYESFIGAHGDAVKGIFDKYEY
jgi:4-hydroxyphenylpyruvate dioxygenase